MTSDAENSRAASGSLEADRLAAAVNAVADRYDPDQIILFGSAARGEMTEGSDIDLLVINDHNHPEAMRRERMRLNGDRIDVVQMRREDVERHRRTAGHDPGSSTEPRNHRTVKEKRPPERGDWTKLVHRRERHGQEHQAETQRERAVPATSSQEVERQQPDRERR